VAANTVSLSAHPASSTGLRSIQPAGWASGLGNLLRNELRPWVSTRFGLIQAAVWLIVVNGFLALPLWVAPLLDPTQKNIQVRADSNPDDLGPMVFFMIAAQFGALGAAILAMGTLVGEKQSGSAAWVLSKPVSRPAFILAKLVALAAGCAVIVVGLQAAVAYFQIGAVVGRWSDPALFAAGAALIGLNVLFALSLTLMLGAFLNSRGAVVGIALGVIFGQQLLGNFVGPIAAYFPNALGSLATMVALGQPVQSYGVVASTVLLIVVFVVATVWRFGRDEL
jgi:ABC-2 type transport system permease protein